MRLFKNIWLIVFFIFYNITHDYHSESAIFGFQLKLKFKHFYTENSDPWFPITPSCIVQELNNATHASSAQNITFSSN